MIPFLVLCYKIKSYIYQPLEYLEATLVVVVLMFTCVSVCALGEGGWGGGGGGEAGGGGGGG